MAVAYRSGSYAETYLSFTNSGTITNGTLTNGDFIVMTAASNLATSTWTMPSGFELIGRYTDEVGYNLAVYAKFAFNEPATYPIIASGGPAGGVRLAAYSGVSPVSPISRIDGSLNELGDDAVTFPNLTAPSSAGLVICSAVIPAGMTMGTTPAGFTLRGAAGRSLWIDKTVAGTGSVGAPVWPVSSGDNVSVGVSLHLSATAVAPYNVNQPEILGNNWNGQSMRADPNEWLGVQAYYYQWNRDGVAI